jgi:diphthamide synthase subunit DPH2
VFRVLLQYAKELKDHQYQLIILAAYGKKKFVVSGDYFQQLGREYNTQNPVYIIRTFSHHVSTMDGATPFPEPNGGLLLVLKEEMEQFNQFNRLWYLDDFIVRHK